MVTRVGWLPFLELMVWLYLRQRRFRLQVRGAVLRWENNAVVPSWVRRTRSRQLKTGH